MFVFFFKQKTAYEVRISDWSSDVCSSDLRHRPGDRFSKAAWIELLDQRGRTLSTLMRRGTAPRASRKGRGTGNGRRARSEEHTSELQSLMRISYAVFCLKKKKNRMTRP